MLRRFQSASMLSGVRLCSMFIFMLSRHLECTGGYAVVHNLNNNTPVARVCSAIEHVLYCLRTRPTRACSFCVYICANVLAGFALQEHTACACACKLTHPATIARVGHFLRQISRIAHNNNVFDCKGTTFCRHMQERTNELHIFAVFCSYLFGKIRMVYEI